jgi:hypothetical protein
MLKNHRTLPLALLTAMSCTGIASASERNFAFTYQTPVLGPGEAEFEPHTTWKYGKETYFSRFDERLEFELGLTKNLQTAFYINLRGQAEETLDPVSNTTSRESEISFEGISSEWKLQLSDPVADALGTGLYLEGTLAPLEAKLEPKLLIDKRVGQFLVAANLVGEAEFGWEDPDDKEQEYTLEVVAGAGYYLAPTITFGAEVQQKFVFKDGLETAPLFLGPNLSVAEEKWWLTMSVLPQITSWTREAYDGVARDRLDSVALQSKLVLGFHL